MRRIGRLVFVLTMALLVCLPAWASAKTVQLESCLPDENGVIALALQSGDVVTGSTDARVRITTGSRAAIILQDVCISVEEGCALALDCNDWMTVALEGSSVVSTKTSSTGAMDCYQDVTLAGSGSLEVLSEGTLGINCVRGLTIRGADVSATSKKGKAVSDSFLFGAPLTVESGRLRAVGATFGISWMHAITFAGGEVEATGGSYGIQCDYGFLTTVGQAAKVSASSVQVKYAAGSPLPAYAGEAPEGQRFRAWQVWAGGLPGQEMLPGEAIMSNGDGLCTVTPIFEEVPQPPLPSTGDKAEPVLWLALLCLCALALALVLPRLERT